MKLKGEDSDEEERPAVVSSERVAAFGCIVEGEAKTPATWFIGEEFMVLAGDFHFDSALSERINVLLNRAREKQVCHQRGTH